MPSKRFKMKILLTGATGFVGNCLAKYFSSNSICYDVLVRAGSDISRLPFIDSSKIHVHDGTIECALGLFNNLKFDTVIHCGGLVLPSHAPEQLDDLIKSNILFSTQLLEAICTNADKTVKFINVSSYLAYDINKKHNSNTLYGLTKVATSILASYYDNKYNIRMTTLNLGAVYGKGDFRPRLLNILKDASETGKTLKMSPGYQKLDLIHIDDVIAAFVAALELLSSKDEPLKSDYWVTTRQQFSLREIVALYEKVSNRMINIDWNGEYRNSEVMNPYSGSDFLENWNPTISLTEGLIRDYI